MGRNGFQVVKSQRPAGTEVEERKEVDEEWAEVRGGGRSAREGLGKEGHGRLA